MRIGIDATCWANKRGYGRFTRELVTALAGLDSGDDLVCFLDERSARQFALAGPHVHPVLVNQRVAPTLAAATGGQRSLFDMLRLTQAVRQARLDVFFSPSVYAYFPLPPGLAAVVTVHDAIAERFPELTLPNWRDRIAWRLKVALALWQARLVLTVSDYAADDIATYFRIPRSDLRVTLEGVSADFRPSDTAADIQAAARRAGVPDGGRWLIYVGGFGPHKHVDLLVRAHAAVARRRHDEPPLTLLLVGEQRDGFHSEAASIERAIEECQTAHLVKWTGYLPDAELRHLYSGALALALVSAAEGFGLPAVEAARCGTPVIATTASPLPRLLEGGGVFVDPGDVAALEQALDRLASNEPERLLFGRRALDRAQALSWSQSAQRALDALHEATRRVESSRVAVKAGSNAHPSR